MEYLNEVITALSIVAAILAWIAKLRWSKEYTLAKDEIIKAKEAQITLLKQQIENLKDLNPAKLKEYFNVVKEQLNQYNELLKEQLKEAKNEIKVKAEEIKKLKKEEEKNKEEIETLSNEKVQLEKSANELETEIESFPAGIETNDIENFIIQQVDTQNFHKISETSNQLKGKLMHFDKNNELNKLSKILKKNIDQINDLNRRFFEDQTDFKSEFD